MLKNSGTRVAGWSVAALCVVALAPTAFAQRQAGPNPGVPSVPAGVAPGGALGAGTIQYDNDTPFNRNGTDGGTVGNRFGNLVDPHSIATVSFAVAGNYGASVVMTVWDVNPASVVVLARQLVLGIAQSPAPALRFTAALATPVVGHNGDFIAGIRNTDYDPCNGNAALASTCDGVALTNGTGPSEFRAARVNFNSGVFVPTVNTVASTGQDIANVNAIFRVTGDNLPVELMDFSIE